MSQVLTTRDQAIINWADKAQAHAQAADPAALRARAEARRAAKAEAAGKARQPLTADQLICKYTMWKSMDEAIKDLTKPGNGYRPSIYTNKRRHKEKTAMADAIDAALKAAGSDKTCWRGS